MTPEQIVRCLDELELYSDDPVKVARLTGELRERFHQWALDGELRRDEMQATIDDQRRLLSASLRLPV